MRPYLESHRPIDPARFTARPTPVLERYARWLEGAFRRGDADLRHYAAYVAARAALRGRRDVSRPSEATPHVAYDEYDRPACSDDGVWKGDQRWRTETCAENSTR